MYKQLAKILNRSGKKIQTTWWLTNEWSTGAKIHDIRLWLLKNRKREEVEHDNTYLKMINKLRKSI
jgi:hypothetical protein